MNFQSKNPFSQEVWEEHPLMDDSQVAVCLQRSVEAFRHWKKSPVLKRAEILERTAALLEERVEKLARLITLEMGKPLAEARSEILKCVAVCRYYAARGDAFLAAEIIHTEASQSGVYFEPTGCILAIMPWNFPFWQVFRYAAPCLMAGNVCLLKHAPNVSASAKAIEQLFREAGLQEYAFQTVIIDLDLVEQIIAADIITGIAFTGSEGAGSKVASLAGRYLKKVVLELGGSDPFIVLADADLEKAVKAGLMSRMINGGQACNGAKRFIIEEPVYTRFVELFLAEAALIRQGDPLDPLTTMGPLARVDLAENLEKQLTRSLDQGAEMLLAGSFDGCNVKPFILTGVKPGMAAFDEETFGPLAAICSVPDARAAMALANQTRYGLAASLWTGNADQAKVCIRELDAGNVFINSIVRSDPRLPFGGTKKSGYGRELSRQGLYEFMNLKTFYIG